MIDPDEEENLFDKLGGLADLMRNAGQIRESMEQAAATLASTQVEGTAGGGSVTVRVNGRLEVLTVRIDPKLLADGDAELLEDLIASAANQALARAREAAAQAMQAAAGGLTLPALDQFFSGGPGSSSP